ncbi:DUF2303 family protein [Sinorhizobium medicae]|nr:DUF2303 family protein [Sinorhizobium medicae]MDX0592609.1 DUF2303 family protein [Sinorhizobium medicae]MDX0611181.1 DUF2303 family protein [Sinorhizobium medicae]MDX0648243.1 DUF2303 family protein [Sinorhizobium medicae]MDX0741360.1 DUF2303 family protein [Sinorhizobium medicae]
MTETQNKLGAALDIAAIHDLSDRAGSQIATLSLSTAIPGVPSTIPVFVDRKSGTVSNVADLFERYREHPRRKSGTAKVATLESLISLIDRHKTEHSAIFAETNWEKPSITAVFDYHEGKNGGLADNGKHRAHYEFPLSEEWRAWVKINGKPLEQVEFAEFIEDHIAELSAPDSFEAEDFRGKFGFKFAYPNELVALSRGLQVHAETRVKNNVVLQSGEGEITWDEEHRDAQGNKLTVPGMFILSIAPFFMGDPTRIPVRLRYRVSGGKVLWICQLYRPDVHITQQVMRDLERVAHETELPHFQGTPEMPSA